MKKWMEHFASSAFRRSSDVAHDLKTPLNVGVLNLELLRMRTRKILSTNDAKAESYMKAIELELRRMGRIFDAYFVYSAPPRDHEIEQVDLAESWSEAAASSRHSGTSIGSGRVVAAHRSRVREMLKLILEGVEKIMDGATIIVTERDIQGAFCLVLEGEIAAPEAELGKIFKFYYTDGTGSPDLALATARLIAETYGGTLELIQEGKRGRLELTLPTGEQ